MARTALNSAGPEINHFPTYSPTVPAGFSIVTTPAPPQGTYWFQGTAINENFDLVQQLDVAFPALTFYWYVLRGFRVETTIVSGDIFGINIFRNSGNAEPHTFRYLRGKGSGVDLWQVEITDSLGAVLGLGTTSFGINTTVNIRVEFTATRIKVWVNGGLEIDIADVFQPGDSVVFVGNNIRETKATTKKWNRLYLSGSNLESDRPGTTVWIDRQDPNANDVSEYGDQASCGTTNGTFTNWDDYVAGGVPDNDTTFNCGESSRNIKELSALTNPAIPGGLVAEGAKIYYWLRANAPNKTVDNWSVTKYVATEREVQLPNMASDTYHQRAVTYTTPPGGGAWSQTIFDGLIAGHRVVSTNGAHSQVSALATEVAAVNNDPPPPPPAVARRRGVRVM